MLLLKTSTNQKRAESFNFLHFTEGSSNTLGQESIV